MSEQFWRHLEPGPGDDQVTLPGACGGEPTTISMDDPDAGDRLFAYLDAELAHARAQRDEQRAERRDRFLRACQPGYFELALDEYGGELHLERRLVALEGLVVEGLR
jgi:hypothetical protein